MFDPSYSDIDHTVSCDGSQESEMTNQLIDENQITLLREQNDHLMKENSSLRAQFEDALLITKQVEEMHQNNRQLKSTVREYQAKIDSLNQRLEISSRTIEGLNQKLDDEKANSIATREKDHISMKKEVERIKNENKAQLDSLYEKLDQFNKEKEKNDVESKLINGKIEKCLDNAQHFFQTKFQYFDDFIIFLSQAPFVSQVDQQQNHPQFPCQQQPSFPKDLCSSSDQIQVLTKKLKRERAKLKEKTIIQDELEATINKLKREQYEITTKHQFEINALKKEYEQKEEDMNMQDADQKHQIQQLLGKIESLKKEIKKKSAEEHSQAPPPQIVIRAPPASQSKRRIDSELEIEAKRSMEQNKELDLAVEQLTRCNNELSNQLKNSLVQRDELNLRIRELEASKQDQDEASIKYKNDLNALTIVHKETLVELETLRNALHDKETILEKKTKSRLKKEVQSFKSKTAGLESTIESQKKQIYELSLANEQANRSINQLTQKLDESKNTIDESQRSIDYLRDELATVQQALDDKPSVTPEDVMPPNIWRSSEFGTDVADQISKIALNSSLQPPSKLQNIYKIIRSHYTKQITERDQALSDAHTELQTVKNIFNQFLINISISLGIEPVNLETFLSNTGPCIIIATLNKLRTTCDDFKRLNEQFTNALLHISKTFSPSGEADINLVIEQTNCIKEQLNSNSIQLQKRSKKYHEISASFKALKKKYDTDTQDLNSQISHLSETIDQLTKANNDLTQSNQQFKHELQTMKNDYRDFKDKKEENEANLVERHEEDQQAWNQEKSQLETRIQQLLNSHGERASEAADEIAEKDAIIEHLKNTIQAQKSTISERDREIANLKQSSDNSINDLTEKASKEKKQIIKSYEKAVEEITEQCNTHRRDVEKMAKVVAETEKKCKQYKSKLMQIKRENLKLNTEIQSQKEQNDRDKKLADSTARSAILTAETNFNTRLDEQKSKCETEKRRIYSFIADTFKQYFNPHEGMDEKSFKSIVSRARDELSRLIASDLAIRRLVGAASHQKTDDAVAQLIMNNNNI